MLHRPVELARYRAINYTERLAEAKAVSSLFESECIRNPVIRPKGGLKSVSDVEIAVAEYVDWFSHRRLPGVIGHVPPAEFEANHWAQHVVTD